MQTSRRTFLKLSGATLAAGLVSPALVQAGEAAQRIDPVLHLLNRMTWGPRPEEVMRIGEIGATAYLDEQLQPERINDAQTESMIHDLPILAMERRSAHRLSDYRNPLRAGAGVDAYRG